MMGRYNALIVDAAPNDPSYGIDTDGDGYPNIFNEGYNLNLEAKFKDGFPYDPTRFRVPDLVAWWPLKEDAQEKLSGYTPEVLDGVTFDGSRATFTNGRIQFSTQDSNMIMSYIKVESDMTLIWKARPQMTTDTESDLFSYWGGQYPRMAVIAQRKWSKPGIQFMTHADNSAYDFNRTEKLVDDNANNYTIWNNKTMDYTFVLTYRRSADPLIKETKLQVYRIDGALMYESNYTNVNSKQIPQTMTSIIGGEKFESDSDSAAIVFGARHSSDDYNYSGTISDFRLYKKIYSDEELADIISDMSIDASEMDSDDDGVVDVNDAFPDDTAKFKPELSVLSLADGTKVLQLTGARVTQTNGGLALGAKRTLYINTNDQNTLPSYQGIDWPHVQLAHLPDLPDGVSIDHAIADGVYTIGGKPVYQYRADDSETSALGTLNEWRLVGMTGVGIWEDPDNDGFDSSTRNALALDLNKDDFPDDPAASVDSDGDGYPDAWNQGKSQANSTSGLLLDLSSFDPNISVDSSALIPEFSDPSKLVGLVGWFTVNDATVQLKDGKIKTWKNLMGSYQNFSQPNKTVMPVYNQSSASIEFTGTEFLEMKQKKPTDNTIFIVSKGRGDLFGDTSTYVSVRYQEVRLGTGEDTDALTRIETPLANISDKVIYVLRNSASDNSVKLKLGNSTISNRSNQLSRKGRDSSLFVGKAGKVVSQGFRGEIYEILIYNRVLTDREVELIQNDLSLRWDVLTSEPTEISVDQGYEGASSKGTSVRPLKRLKDAFKRVFRGGRVKVKKGEYKDPMTVTENVVIEADDGDVILGTPKVEQQ
jgi:hypothetical protein